MISCKTTSINGQRIQCNHEKTIFWNSEEGDRQRRTVEADLEGNLELVHCAWVIIQEIDSTVDANACNKAFEAEHCA